jgi:putative peptidoglycan lipid II flippase
MSKDLKRSGRVSLAIACSRVLGLIRDLIFANFFGAGLVMDAFNVAFRIPNLLRDLFAEGSMSTAFVTRFSAIRKTEGDESAFELARKVITLLTLVVGVTVLCSIIYAEEIVMLFADSFKGKVETTAFGHNVFQLSVTMIELMFPFLWLVSIAAVFTGILNTFRRFGLPAMAPALFNIGTICGGGLSAYLFYRNGIEPIFGMALGTCMGGVLQWVLLMPQLRKVAFKFKPDFRFKDPHLKSVLLMLLPAAIGQSAFQINLIITTKYAADMTEGSVSWLSYAYRFMQLPIGVFSVAIAIVALPNLAELIAEKKFKDFSRSLCDSLRLCLFLTLPASIGLYMLAEPIVSVIYGHGKFLSAVNIENTAGALKYYVLGLAAWSLVKIFGPAYYANNKAWIPMWSSFLAIATNAGLCYYFIHSDWFPEGQQHYGLALATTLAALVNGIALYLISLRFEWRLKLLPLIPYFLKLLVACAALMGSVYLLHRFVIEEFSASGKMVNTLTLFGSIGVSALVFLLVAKVLKLEECDILLGRFTKKKER